MGRYAVGTIYRHAIRRVQRRALAYNTARPDACSHWRTCHHHPCAAARRADTLLREACRLANDLAR